MQMNDCKTRWEWLADYEDFRDAYGYKKLKDDVIHVFLKWCDRNYQKESRLTQEMLDAWGPRREKESAYTYGNRVAAVNGFLRHINSRCGNQYHLYEYEWSYEHTEPVLFTKDEMLNFFRALDEIQPNTVVRSNRGRLQSRLSYIQLPVIFRMLYSTGMRVNEVRWLHRDDVNLETGVVQIHRSKGYIERSIVLHPSLLALVRKYDKVIRSEIPDAEPLFPSFDGKYHNHQWLNKYFKMFWYKYNPRPENYRKEVVAYAFRHNYAVENIMKWNQNEENADKKLVALSRSMGHVYIQSTQYYYHLVPRFAESLEEMEGAYIDKIIPEVQL